jgi:hypothetical protein
MTYVLSIEMNEDEDIAVAIARGLAKQFDLPVEVTEKATDRHVETVKP